MEKTAVNAVIFAIEEQSYALDISKVTEIIQVAEITSLPQCPEAIEGVINLRGQVIPILNLRAVLSKKKIASAELPIIILQLKDVLIGLMVDAIKGVDQEIGFVEDHPVPNSASYFIGAIKDSQGGFIFVLDPDQLPKIKDYQKFAKQVSSYETKELLQQEEKTQELISLVAFSVGNEQYALEFDNVLEVLETSKITPLPTVASFIKGVINYRGDIVSVTDLAIFFGIQDSENEDTHLVIVNAEDKRTALVCKQMPEMVSIARKKIQPPPPNLTSEQAFYIKGEVQLDERLLVLLDVNKIFESRTMKQSIGEADG